MFAAACLFAGKKNSTWGNICQFEMLFVQFTLQRSGPNWPFFRGAMMEQSPALRAMTEAGARRRKIEALKTQMEHLKEELQMVVAVEILMRQESGRSTTIWIRRWTSSRSSKTRAMAGSSCLLILRGAETFQVESMRRMSLRMWQTAITTVIDHKLWQSTQELEKLESELRRR